MKFPARSITAYFITVDRGPLFVQAERTGWRPWESSAAQVAESYCVGGRGLSDGGLPLPPGNRADLGEGAALCPECGQPHALRW